MARRLTRITPVICASLLGLSVVVFAWPQKQTRLDRHWGPNIRVTSDEETRRRIRFRPRPYPAGADARAAIEHWNRVAIDAAGLDHAVSVQEGELEYAEQLGPGRTSRAMAIVHIAMFDAVNAIAGVYRGYTDLPRAPFGASIEAAVARAAHDTLVDLYSAQTEILDEELADALDSIRDGPAKTWGVWTGRRAAALILEQRAHDNSRIEEPVIGETFFTRNAPGKWRMDPVSEIPIALGAYWGIVKPFAISSARRFRVPPPPDLDSDEYTAAYNEVKRLGGDNATTPSERTPEQTFIATFWAYDGTPSLCAPPRLYNQIAVTIANQRHTNALDLARLLALVNVALADAAIAAWESKYYYQFWRPITAIRESDPGFGPTGLGDGNPDTIGDPTFTPLGAPASNLMGPNFTPPFPAYPSGHAVLGAALFQTLRRFYGTDDVAFTLVSDEFNGVTKDNKGNVRPLRPRSFESLSQAEDENGQSRIYLGIHFAFDKNDGIAQGRRIADAVFQSAFRPIVAGDRR